MKNSSEFLPTVLVVEDEIIVRMGVAGELEDAGYCVIEAENAEEALREFQARDHVTALFSDINMPGAFDGLSLAHKIFELRPSVQLILTSGQGEPPQSEMPPGVHFLAKPYQGASLKGLLKAG